MRGLYTRCCLTLGLCLFGVLHLWADKDSTAVRLKFSGFVNAQLFYDSRQTVMGREALLMLYPAAVKLDDRGEDINAAPQFNQLGMISRLTATLTGPMILGAASTAVLEGDFSGQTNGDNNGFRLRHAFIRMTWPKVTALVGQYWHPINVIEAVPDVPALSTGAPFRPFSRHPQVRVDYRPIEGLSIIAVAASQRDYASEGPQGASSTYLRQAVIPNVHLQVQGRYQAFFAALGVDYKQIKPRLSMPVLNYKMNERLNSWALMGLVRYDFKPISIKVQGVYGQNLTEHVMLGGYVEAVRLLPEPEYTYLNSSQVSAWADISTRFKSWNIGLLMGYAKTLGYDRRLSDQWSLTRYGRGMDIDYVYRLAPRVSYRYKPLLACLEFDYSVASYGNPDQNGRILGSIPVSNARILLSLTYYF